jgi:hypothetical protein
MQFAYILVKGFKFTTRHIICLTPRLRFSAYLHSDVYDRLNVFHQCTHLLHSLEPRFIHHWCCNDLPFAYFVFSLGPTLLSFQC